MKVKAICFDLDGTLLNTVADLAAACNEVLRERGYPEHDATLYATFVGDGAAMLMERALPPEARAPEHVAECVTAFQVAYAHHWDQRSEMYDGIPELLTELCRRGIRLSVLSNKPHHYTTLCMTHYFKGWPFEVVLGQREGVPKKPDPSAALEIADDMSINPKFYLFVGDSGVDMATGKAAEMQSLGVSWGYRPVEELTSHNPLGIIHHPRELLAFID